MINIAEILKYAPRGTKLWSNLYGEVEFEEVDEENVIEIHADEDIEWFNPDGKLKYSNFPDGECVLWPSKDHRAWDDEALRILSIEKKPEAPFNLQPFDKVLVRDSCSDKWHAGFFSHIDGNRTFPYRCVGSMYRQCIPYNDETKHLSGTTQIPPEKYRQ